MSDRLRKKVLLGLGFDSIDGHVRITKGNNFHILGGSQQTHKILQNKIIEFNDFLAKNNKRLDDISDREFLKISYSIGLKIPKNKKAI